MFFCCFHSGHTPEAVQKRIAKTLNPVTTSEKILFPLHATGNHLSLKETVLLETAKGQNGFLTDFHHFNTGASPMQNITGFLVLGEGSFASILKESWKEYRKGYNKLVKGNKWGENYSFHSTNSCIIKT